MPTKSVATKQSDSIMENQLDVPTFGQKKEQPEVNVQVVFEKSSRIDSEEKGTLFILYSFAFLMTLLKFVLLVRQVW